MHNEEQESQPHSETDEMVRCVRILLDDNCRLTVMDFHREMVIHFMHEVGCGTVECALKEFEMHNVCVP